MARGSKESRKDENIGERRRRELVGAAYALIAEKGMEGLRTRDIAARAGVNVSTLHYYFGTKEALLEAVVQLVTEKFAGPNDPGEPPPRFTVREHFERAWSTFQRNPQLATVLQEFALRAQRDATTRTAFRPIFKFWNHLVQEIIGEEMRRGAVRSDVRADDLALIVTSFIVGAITQLGVNSRALDFLSLSRQVEQLLTSRRR
jgi:AcrR family transcriptional regulator